MRKNFLILIIITLLLIRSSYSKDQATARRLDEVACRGAMIMPFSLERTKHQFTKTKDGGFQQVLAKDGADSAQIQLIQTHLSMISNQFKRGDFSGPAKIHGGDMPGLKELESARPGTIKIRYSDLPKGAEIVFSTIQEKYIEAIHRYFDAQLHDHARHAASGHIH